VLAAAAPVPDTGNLRSDLIAGLDDVRQLLSSSLGTVLLDVARSRDDDLDELRQTYWHALVFELLVGPIHARTLFSPDTLDDVETTTIVDSVLNSVAKPV
jgi:hypothetical protein